MRTIKFRGKSVSNDEWIFGSLILLNGDYWIQSFDAIRLSRVIPESVGQFVCQINGVEIYEGDILEHQFNKVVLKYDEIINCECCNEIQAFGFDFESLYYKEYKVIGNTTDNKELIPNN